MKRPTHLYVGDMFRVIEGNNNFNVGDIITFKEDDGTNWPYFWNENKSNWYCIHFYKLEPYTKTTKPKSGKNKMKNKQKDYTSQAIFLIVAYLVVFTFCTLVAISSLWSTII